MHPLIKWPGGKSKEYEQIKSLIPNFSRYIEPFFGGGAIFFNLKSDKAVINDICEELIEFYRFIKGENNKTEFKQCLYDYVDNWEKIPRYLKIFENDLFNLYGEYKADKRTEQGVKEIITHKLKAKEDQFNGLFSKYFALDPNNLFEEIIKNLISKMKRTKQIEKERGALPKGDLHKNIETAFRSGFYMHFRDVMNKNGTKYKTSLAKKIANYYFIREFCYGAMFRFSYRGYFNIPYGGIAYNQKDFRKKVDYIFSDEVEKVFKNTKILNSDFEEILTNKNLTGKDFIFLDPPYDTDFSNYEKKDFDKKDQERLANCLYKTKAKFILIIKKTPFIHDLYSKRVGIIIDSFEKKYLYNMKGRNDRNVEHLIIYNYKLC
ncbi:MAG: DNA adenine methylase [Endomicrobiales bacterium]|nr:DNA adenine methylase [Endomicrobiales bacterium]